MGFRYPGKRFPHINVIDARLYAEVGYRRAMRRSKVLSSARRQEIARIAANARWARYRQAHPPASSPAPAEAAEVVVVSTVAGRSR